MSQFLGFGGVVGRGSEKKIQGEWESISSSVTTSLARTQVLGALDSRPASAQGQLELRTNSTLSPTTLTGFQTESPPFGSVGLDAFCCCPWHGGQC